MRNCFIFIALATSLLILTPSAWSAIELKYEGWEMTVETRISQQYTDNLTYEEEDKVDKLMTTVSVMIDADYTGRRRSFSVRGDIVRWFDVQDFEVLRETETLRLKFSHQFSEYDTINLNNLYAHSAYPLGFEDEFGKFTVIEDIHSNNFNIAYSRELSEQFRVTANYNNIIYWASTDSIANSVGLQLDYIYSVATSAFISYGYMTRRYEDDGTATVNSVSAGLRKYITKRLSMNGSAGFSFVSPVGGGESVTGTYNISLSNEIDVRTTGRLSFVRGVSTTVEGDVFTSWQVNGTLARDMMENLKGSFSIFYGEGEYELLKIRDTFVGASGNLNYIFGRRLTGNLGYTYSDRDSTENSRNYTVNMISAGITLTF